MKKIKCRFFCIPTEFVLFCAILFSFGGNPALVSAQASASKSIVPVDELDAAIRETSDYFNKQLPKGNKLIIINIQSDYPALSEYIIDELTANAVNDRIFSVVDRQQLNTIRTELDFQMSGDVDDTTAQFGGYNDWFLPSKNELDLMYINLKLIRDVGKFSDEWYWSSTESGIGGGAWAQLFKDGQQNGDASWGHLPGNKTNTYSVRAYRQF